MSKIATTKADKPILVCDDCGKTGDDVSETTCPYASEMSGIEEECILCGDCYSARVADI